MTPITVSQVLAVQRDWLAAVRAKDINALMKMVTDDIIVIHPNGRLCEGLTNSAPTLSEFLDSSNWSSLRLLKKP